MALDYKSKKKLKKILGGIIFSILLCLSILTIYFPNDKLPQKQEILGQDVVEIRDDLPCTVHFLDVGQADCSLIYTPSSTILIDTGEVDDYPKIKATLEQYNIQKIDYLILTHAHADHIGSADDILLNFQVDYVIMPKYAEEQMPTSRVYESLLNALQKSNAKIIEAKPGLHFELLDISFDILGPMHAYDNINNSSVVTKVYYKNQTFLFQGDAEKESETDILNSRVHLQANVLKLGHHGSKTSSTDKYLSAVNPSFAVISCGFQNKYNLPNQEILDRLSQQNIEYRRTDLNGDIIIRTDGEKLYLETEK